MAGYTRQSTFADGDTITAALFNNEYNQLLNAFSNTGGHKHDGTANEGPVIGLIGDAGETAPNNKVLIDTTNNYIEFYVQVSDSPVQQLYIADGAIVPVTDNDIDLGTSSLQFKDLYINGTANIDSLVLATGSTVTAVLDEDDLSSDSATSLVTQQSVKAYIDAQVTAQDLDFLGDSGGALSIDLDSESLTIAGGTGLDTVGSGNTVTVNIDATVATLTGSQTLTNKTIDVDNNTVSNIEVDNFKASAIVLESEGIGSNDNDTSLPTSAAVKDYVDTQITAEDLDITTDSGTIAIDLDSETLTVSGGTGLDSSATGNAVTLAIDSTVTTLTGTQTLTNKTLTSPDVNTPDIDGGTIDGATIATSDVTVGAGKTLDVSAGTLTLADNQISGDKVEGGTIAATTITDLTFGSLNDGTITATAFVDEDNMASNSATLIPTQQSVKAYVDTTVAATNEVVEDTTPQLGGDLDLNSSDITGTGNINITGTIQSSGNITGTLATAAQPNITSVGTLTGLTTSGDINFGDSDKAVFGAGSDLQIYHDGSNSYIKEVGIGSLVIDGTNITIRDESTGKTAIDVLNNTNAPLVNLRYDNSTKLATTSTGIDVTGTATMDGLTVDGTGTLSTIGNGTQQISTYVDADEVSLLTGGSARLDLWTGGNRTMRLDANGDISFYDDTGTSQALFWDASAERLGIGTTSPNQKLNVSGGRSYFGANNEAYAIGVGYNGTRTAANQTYFIGATNATAPDLQFSNSDGGEKVRITHAGNVGIGTLTPGAYYAGAEQLVVAKASGEAGITIATASNTNGALYFADGTTGAAAYQGGIGYQHDTSKLFLVEGGAATCFFGPTEYVFNEASLDRDFRVESNGKTHMLFVDGGNDRVGIMNSAPATSLHIGDSSGSQQIRLESNGGGASIKGTDTVNNASSGYTVGHLNGTNRYELTLGTIPIFDMYKTAVIFNEGSVDMDFRVESNGNANMFFVDGGLNKVGIGHSSFDSNSLPLSLGSRTGSPLNFINGTSNTISSSTGIFVSHSEAATGNTSYGLQLANNNNTADAKSPVIAFSALSASGSYQHTYATIYGEKVGNGADTNWNTGRLVFGVSDGTGSDDRMILNQVGGLSLYPNDGGHTVFNEGSADADFRIESNSNTHMLFVDGGNNRVGIGVASGSFGAALTIENAASYNIESRRTGTGSEGHIAFRNGNGAVGTIFTNGSATTYNTSSDARLKDVTGKARGLEVINKLNPVAYNWKADGKADEGLIAQKVLNIVPNAVSGSEKDMYQMDYSKLVVHLVAGMKEQQTQIDALQSEINLLKGE